MIISCILCMSCRIFSSGVYCRLGQCGWWRQSVCVEVWRRISASQQDLRLWVSTQFAQHSSIIIIQHWNKWKEHLNQSYSTDYLDLGRSGKSVSAGDLWQVPSNRRWAHSLYLYILTPTWNRSLQETPAQGLPRAKLISNQSCSLPSLIFQRLDWVRVAQ